MILVERLASSTDCGWSSDPNYNLNGGWDGFKSTLFMVLIPFGTPTKDPCTRKKTVVGSLMRHKIV